MGYQLLTTRGYDFYEVASALQKSIRRGDVRTAGYFALELFPKYADYCWRRLLTISAEDCYGIITKEIYALYESFKVISSKKQGGGRVFISKAVILLCEAKHNRDADLLSNYVYDKKYGVTDEEIDQYLQEVREEGTMDVPSYVYDCHTRAGKRQGKTKEDFFKEEQMSLFNVQPTLFDDVVKEITKNDHHKPGEADTQKWQPYQH